MATATRRRRPVDDDEEPDATPRRRRPVDDAEEAPRRRRPADDDDEPDDDDVEEAPRRSRRSKADDDEEEPPRRRAGAGTGPGGRAGRGPASKAPRGRLSRGWGGYDKVRASSSDFEEKFRPTNKAQVIALLEADGPFASFARHWVDLEEGKRAFICPASLEIGDEEDPLECPLCDVGDKPNSPKAYLNVAVLTPGEKPQLAVWEIGAGVSEQLQTIDKALGRKTSLTDVYIKASATGSGLKTKYFTELVDEEDLYDLELDPLTDKQRNSFELYDESLYEIPTLKELNRVADEIA